MTNPLHNIASENLANEYGVLKAQADHLAKRLDAIKDEFKRRQVETAEGSQFTVTLGVTVSRRLDTTALKAALGEDICREYEKETTATVVRVKPTAVFDQSQVAA
jgi:uncharacterized alkaline shock family protein YloU